MGTILASGSSDNTIKLWNLETKTEIATRIKKNILYKITRP